MMAKVNTAAEALSCFLSEVPALFRSKRRKIEVAIIHVSPPDKHGFCSLGVSVDVARAAVEVDLRGQVYADSVESRLLRSRILKIAKRFCRAGTIPTDLLFIIDGIYDV